MALYKNIIQWTWNLTAGEHVAFIRYPFKELILDPVFKVLSIDTNKYVANIEVVKSDFLAIGTVYNNQPIAGLRRVKLTTIKDDLTYNNLI